MSIARILADDVFFTMRPLNLKDLALLYHVSRRTMSNWLKPFADKIGPKNGYYYSVVQVKRIFELLGPPAAYRGEQ
jgi:nitrous oxide reductase accessory protein NosL